MTEYTPGAGDVAIVLLDGGGKPSTSYLRPTLGACMRLSRSGATGPRILADQVMALNFDAICFVVAVGLDEKQEDVQEQVYRTGTTGLFAACIKFIHNVSNGGRPYSEDGDDATADPLPGG